MRGDVRIGVPVVHRNDAPAAMQDAAHRFVQHVGRKELETRQQREDARGRSRTERKGKERAKIVSGLHTPPSSPPDDLLRASNSTTYQQQSDLAVGAACTAAADRFTRPNGSGRREDPILLDSEDELSDHASGDELPVQEPVRSAGYLIEQAREGYQEHSECRDNMCAEFQFVARTFNSIYDDLLEIGYVLPNVLDMDVLRELANGPVTGVAAVLDAPYGVEQRGCKPSASQHRPPGTSLAKRNLNSKPPVEKAEVACDPPTKPVAEAQLREMCGEPARNRICKPPVRDSIAREHNQHSDNVQGGCSSQLRGDAGADQRAQGQTRSKLVYWTAEEDHELMLGMHDGLNASEIRRRHDLGHRTESAIRSRRAMLKRKYSEMFDHDERLERLD